VQVDLEKDDREVVAAEAVQEEDVFEETSAYEVMLIQYVTY
jgi:hypothetical protein